ncbi:MULTISPECIES: hypothetical protein [Crateriforma]|uniref:Uncharacterized protein n=1 Tax=Crateriforma conspicua TaxID=2527996 RepID=A0A5C6FRH3_9PLAN|nr:MULTISPECIES: hypothetical protein [Crateriforma]TWU63158.1 hypothetical protein V7x_48980 [Crateriforma conspicua]
MTNPYQAPADATIDSPSAAAASRPSLRLPRGSFGVWLSVYLYPLWLIGSFYMTWWIAWRLLGHRPRPSLDDPKSIGGVLDFLYYVPGILLVLMPILAPIGLASSFLFPFNVKRKTRCIWGTLLLALYISIGTTVIHTLRSDPDQVIQWWFD